MIYLVLIVKLLQTSADVMASYVTFFINKSFLSATVIEDWKQSRVTALYKGKGSKSDFNSYKPISVICHIANLMEQCVHSHLFTYLESHDFITSDQSA